MIRNKKIIALIPARGGSKSVPKKNIRILAGKPLITYSIKEALKSQYIDRVIVSTDDSQIAKIANEYNAEVPFIRPPELAGDEVTTLPVLQHAVRWLEKEEGYCPEIVILLQPTSPLRKAEHINQALTLFFDTNADSVISVCESSHSPYWMRVVDSQGRINPFIEKGLFAAQEPGHASRHNLPKTFLINGAIYITTPEVLSKDKFLGDDTRALIMNEKDSMDVDSEWDFDLAEFIFGKERGIK